MVIIDKEGEEVAQQKKPACPNRLVMGRLTLERKIWGNHMTQATVGFCNRTCGWHINRATQNEDDDFGHHHSQIHFFIFQPIDQYQLKNALQSTTQPSQIQRRHTVPQTSC